MIRTLNCYYDLLCKIKIIMGYKRLGGQEKDYGHIRSYFQLL
jgi:hypothetical protein